MKVLVFGFDVSTVIISCAWGCCTQWHGIAFAELKIDLLNTQTQIWILIVNVNFSFVTLRPVGYYEHAMCCVSFNTKCVSLFTSDVNLKNPDDVSILQNTRTNMHLL